MTNNIFLPNLPAPEREETISSWLERIFLLSDGAHRRHIQRAVLGKASRHVKGLLPYRLRTFAATVGHYFYDDEQLLTDHTFHPYFAATLTQPAAVQLANRIFNGYPGPLCPARAPLSMASRLDVPRRCPRCERDDLDRLGFAIERRYNVAPFVTRCPIHGEHLRIVGVTNARELIPFRWNDSQSEAVRRNAIRFAEETQRLVKGRGLTVAQCRDRLLELGFVARDGSFRLRRLVDAVSDHFKDGFEDLLLTTYVSDPERLSSGLARMKRSRGYLHPVNLALVNAFIVAQTSRRSVATKENDESIYRLGDLREEDIHDCASVAAVARKIGVATTTASLLLQRAGLSTRFKLAPLSPLELAIRDDLIACHSVTDICERNGSTRPSVYRVMRTVPGLLEARRKAASDVQRNSRRSRAETARLSEGRLITGAEFRESHSVDYRWLFRYDRPWLKAYLATLATSTKQTVKDGRRKFDAHDAESERHLIQAAGCASVQSDGRRPYRATQTRIAKLLGIDYYGIEARLKAGVPLPAEPDENFVRRRLEWVEAMEPELAHVSPANKLKATGLRLTKTRRAICVAAHGETVENG